MSRAALLLPLAALLLIAAGPAKAPKSDLDPEQETEHVVKDGETLLGISRRAKVPRVLIAEANGLTAPYRLRNGQVLKIPRTRRHTVKKGERGFMIADQYAMPWSVIATANGLDASAKLKPGQVLLIPTVIPPMETPEPESAPTGAAGVASSRFAWPLTGPIRRGFTERGTKAYHDGVDIRAAAGTAVRAAEAGKVIFAGNEPKKYGNLVIVEHGGGWLTAYAFLSRVTVKEDDTVGKGERVGLVGHTGLAKGDELHFEIRRRNVPIDPITLLPTDRVAVQPADDPEPAPAKKAKPVKPDNKPTKPEKKTKPTRRSSD